MAYAALLVDLFLVSFIPITIKFSEYELSPDATIFNRFWISTAVLGLWNGISLLKERRSGNSIPVKLFGDTRNLLLLLLMLGVFSGGQHLLYARSLTQTTVANSEVLHTLTPIFTTLFAWKFLGQKFDRRFVIGMAMAIGGSIALAAKDFSITIDKLQGDELALMAALFWAGCILLLEQLQTQLSINVITTWSYLLGTLFLLPIIWVAGDEMFPHTLGIWLVVTAMAILGICSQILITYSLKRLSSGLLATILLLHPVITGILAWGIFSETLSWLHLLSFVVILLGVYLATSSKAGVKATED